MILFKYAFIFLLFVSTNAYCMNGDKKVMVFKAFVLDNYSNSSFDRAYVDTIEIDNINGYVKYNNGSLHLKLNKCETSSWYCLSDGQFEFAVNKNWKGKDKTWRFENIQYTVLDDDLSNGKTFFILAEKTSPQKIITAKNIFQYSLDRGLVGFTTYMKSTTDSLVPVTYIRIY